MLVTHRKKNMGATRKKKSMPLIINGTKYNFILASEPRSEKDDARCR
jgi:hypothetical protein